MATATKSKKRTKSEETKEKDPDQRISHKTDANKVKVGDVMALVHYVKVSSIDFGHNNMQVDALDEGPGSFGVYGRTLIENALSADRYEEEVTVTKTKAAELLVSSYNRPFTVCFVKDSGEERQLRGRLIEPEPLLGRSKVEDLDEPMGKRFRLVDHRTILYLVIDGVRYNVK